jgi:hypothetical protein
MGQSYEKQLNVGTGRDLSKNPKRSRVQQSKGAAVSNPEASGEAYPKKMDLSVFYNLQ